MPPEGAALLKAVSEMSRRRPVVTSRAIYNDRGLKLLEGGVAVDASLYERLVAHRLSVPLDESVECEPAVGAKALRAGAERLLDGVPFFAALGPPGRERRLLLEAIESIPLPRPMAFQLTLLSHALPEVYAHSLQMMLLCARLQAQTQHDRPPMVRRYRRGPSTLVRDQRTGRSTGRLDQVLEGHLDMFLLPPAGG